MGDAFALDELRMMLRFRLDKDLDDVSSPNSTKSFRIFQMVEDSERKGWTGALIAAARETNPGNGQLAVVASEIGLASARADARLRIDGQELTLERLVRDHTDFNDFVPWLAKAGEREAQVCRMEVFQGNKVEYGTGFLVGADLVLTNHHVVASVIAGDTGPDRVLCRFDFKRLADGMELSTGTECRLDHQNEWLLASSPPSPEDEKVNGDAPADDELDYALLRLEKKVGDLPIGKSPQPGAPSRGWVPLAADPGLVLNDILFVLQHPDNEPLKLAAGRVLKLDPNRVRHDANTEGGSSGAPCFAHDWGLVALHHAGDPNFAELHHPEYNQAIPIAKIVSHLEAAGVPLG